MLNIAYFTSRFGLYGWATSIISLLHNCSDKTKLNVVILLSENFDEDKQAIIQLFTRLKFNNFKIIYVDPKEEFGAFKSLHGDWTTYLRLTVDRYFDNEFPVLALDSDTLVELDVCELIDYNFNNKLFAASGIGKVQYSLESDFFINTVNIPPDSIVFNAGIIFFNTIKWREERAFQKCIEFSKNYGSLFRTCDQSILISLFWNQFLVLDKKFNNFWYSDSNPKEYKEKSILHFVGSPKPWDFGSRYIHTGFDKWNVYRDPIWDSIYGKISLKKDLKRLWSIRRSLMKSILKRMKNQ